MIFVTLWTMKSLKFFVGISLSVLSLIVVIPVEGGVVAHSPRIPVLVGKKVNPMQKIEIIPGVDPLEMTGMTVDFTGTTDVDDIVSVGIYIAGRGEYSLGECLGKRKVKGRGEVRVDVPGMAVGDTLRLWVAVSLRDTVDLSHCVSAHCRELLTKDGAVGIERTGGESHRVGVALRQKRQDGVVSSRIPGLATANDGTLLAIFDARHDSRRDLQGDIDIALHRSTDGGMTWKPMQRIIDMGQWGGLPEKYNGVSDACILVDRKNGDVYVAGLWMHGALDGDGKWIEGLTADSTYWVHQWKGRGSQPGTGVKETCQFLIVKSSDNGLTWSAPRNITAETKRPEWWLYAPSPGQGITLGDGTLVFPTEGRDKDGVTFSNIMYSQDNGATWVASEPAYDDVTECNAVELDDGAIMLNMRDNRNRKSVEVNGRRVCMTRDLGKTWAEHPTSRSALREPVCMGSLHRHHYVSSDGQPCSVLLFSNPDNPLVRRDMTLKASFDRGITWPVENQVLYDESKGWGYSSITSIDEHTIGILYESGLANIVFIAVELDEIVKK